MNISSIGYATPPSTAGTFSATDPTSRAGVDTKTSQNTSEAEKTSGAGQQPSSQDLQEAVKVMNDFVGTLNNSLNFTVDGETGKTVVKVMDTQTQEVIKQIPSEEMLAMAHAIDKLKGLLVHQKA